MKAGRRWSDDTSLDNVLWQPQHGAPYSNGKPMPPIEQAWFKNKLKTLNMSQRQLAAKLKLDHAAVSLMLRGKRQMSMDEAKRLADLLLVPVTEVMRRAGIDVLDDVRKVPIAGYIGPGCIVHLLPKGTLDTVVAPADVPVGSFALQIRWVNAPSDGWLSFISGIQESPADCVDRLVLLALKDGRMLRGILRRGYKSGLFNIVPMPEAPVLENQEVVWAARVMWIQPT